MFNPEEYQKHNKLQARDNLLFLREYEQKFDWRNNCKSVIDIGSGDGSFTANVLPKFISPDYKLILGCDVNADMVEYATKHHASDRISFRVIDIGANLPEDVYGRYDQAFSFFTLQLARDQRKVFSNIYDLLAPGGGCFLVILGSVPCYFEVYRLLDKSKKWNQWIRGNQEKIVSAYHESDNPIKKIETFMSAAGFKDINVTIEKRTYAYKDMDELKLAMKAINIFPIPEHEFEDYVRDFARVGQEHGYMDENFQFQYELLIAYAKKY